MATKTITVTEDAYERLKAHKREDESFTDVILRLAGSEHDVMEGAGAWAGTDYATAVEEAREAFERDEADSQDALFGN